MPNICSRCGHKIEKGQDSMNLSFLSLRYHYHLDCVLDVAYDNVLFPGSVNIHAELQSFVALRDRIRNNGVKA